MSGESRIFPKSFIAGILIAIGGYANLVCTNKYLGGFLFSIALISICASGTNLFTGKVGKIFPNFEANKLYFLAEVLVINLIAAIVGGLVLRLCATPEVISKSVDLCNAKTELSVLSILVKSIFCGVLVHVGVLYFKKNLLITVLAVAVFVICGFEHCIADMFYFAFSSVLNLKVLLVMVLSVLGNSIGAIFTQLCLKGFKEDWTI